MSLDEPSWWYPPEPPGGADPAGQEPRRLRGGGMAAWALTPIASIYGAVARQRLAQTGERLPRPVVCVGNLTAGGSGKTPVVRALLAFLEARGAHPAVLTRGYGGSLRGPVWVDRDHHTAADVGDEPLMLATGARVMVARDRAAGGRAIIETAPETTVIIMDDGLQNPSLHKDVVFAVMDRTRGIGNGRVIPAGPLRAPLAAQLPLVDAIVFTGEPQAAAHTKPPFVATFKKPILATSLELAAPHPTPGTRAVVFAGIANPARAFRSAEKAGLEIVAQATFKDHHQFTAREAAELMATAERHDATLWTTEKDVQRLDRRDPALAELARRTQVLHVAAKWDTASEAALGTLLARCFGERP